MGEERTLVTQVEVRGKAVDVFVDRKGRFLATFPGAAERWAYALDKLVTHLRNDARRLAVKVSVPFVSLRDGEARRGVATGAHGATGKLLVRWDDGTQGQLELGTVVLRELSGDELAQYGALLSARREAERQLRAFTQGRVLNLERAVEAASVAAAAAEKE